MTVRGKWAFFTAAAAAGIESLRYYILNCWVKRGRLCPCTEPSPRPPPLKNHSGKSFIEVAFLSRSSSPSLLFEVFLDFLDELQSVPQRLLFGGKVPEMTTRELTENELFF